MKQGPVRPEPVEGAGVALVTGAAALWGTWSLVLRPLALPGAATGPIVFALMGVLLLPAAWRGPRPRWDRSTVALVAASAAFDALNVVCFFEAIERTTVAIATLTHYLAPILIALAAPIVDREHVPRARVWAVIATAGLALVLEPWRAHGPIAAGAALGATSAVGYAGNVFVARRLAARIGADRAIAYHALLGAALLAPLAIPHLGAIDADAAARLAVGALVLGSLAGAMYLRGLVRIGASRAAVLTFAEPVVAVVVAWIAWGEALGPPAALGGALILLAGAGVSRRMER